MPNATARCRRVITLLLLCLLGASTVQAQVRGISYTLSPIGEQVYFGENAGLERGFLYGGEAGLGFGRFVELDFVYLRGQNLSTDFSRVTGISEERRELLAELPDRDVGVLRYGGKLKLNLPTQPVVPYALLGAGVIRFTPDHLNPTQTIYLGGGGGLQVALAGRYALSFSAQRFSYRYNMGSTFFDDLDLADLGLGRQSFNQTQVTNWALRAGLQVYVGGRAPGEETALDRAVREQLSGGLRGLSLRIEPTISSLAFSDELNFRKDQRFAGLFAGLNLGPYLGVRGFYWRALERGAFDFQDLQAYGGEIRFELGEGSSLAPYLIAGGGYMDVLGGYVGRDGTAPGDEPFVLAGAGVVLPINQSLSLNAAARSVLMGEEGVHNVDDPGQVRSSWMYGAGLNFAFGDRGEGPTGLLVSNRRDAELREDLRRSEAKLDSLARVLQRLQSGEALPADSAAAPALSDTALAAAPGQADREARMVTLPLPQEGELYIRFGRPGGVSIETILGEGEEGETFMGNSGTLTQDQVEEVVRRTLREQLGDGEATAVTTEQVERIEDMLVRRLDAMEERLQDQLDADLRRLGELADRPATVVVDQTGEASREAPPRQTRRRSVRPFTGVLFGTPNLGVVGARLDVGSRLLGPISLQPEFALGLGAETYAYHVALDAVYAASFAERALGGVRPYLGLGLGMLGFNEKPVDAAGVQMTLNTRLGVDFSSPWGRMFAEYAAYDLFDYNRIVLGYRFGL